MKWTLNIQKLKNIYIIQKFRDFFYRNRVIIIKDGFLIAGNPQAIINNQQELNWILKEIYKQMNNKLDINIFFNKSNFNLKFNPLYRPKGNY